MDLTEIAKDFDVSKLGMEPLGEPVDVECNGVGMSRPHQEVKANFRATISKKAPENARGYKIINSPVAEEAFYLDDMTVTVQYFRVKP